MGLIIAFIQHVGIYMESCVCFSRVRRIGKRIVLGQLH